MNTLFMKYGSFENEFYSIYIATVVTSPTIVINKTLILNAYLYIHGKMEGVSKYPR